MKQQDQSHPLISQAISQLILSQPWFATLALRLRVRRNKHIPTACVDGVTLQYNPQWLGELPSYEVKAVIAHEVMHCALLHMTRRGGRDMQTWNEAGDHVINLELRKAKFRLSDGCLGDSRFDGMGTEQVYGILKREKEARGEDGGEGYIDPLGGVMDAPKDGKSKKAKAKVKAKVSSPKPKPQPQPKKEKSSDDDKKEVKSKSHPKTVAEEKREETGLDQGDEDQDSDWDDDGEAEEEGSGDVDDAESGVGEAGDPGVGDNSARSNQPSSPADIEHGWEVATAQASMVAGKAGLTPAGCDRAVRAARTQLDPRDILQRYLVLPGDYSWTKPNRRHISSGLYLPGQGIERPGRIVIAVDTSGSVDQRLLRKFAGWSEDILNAAGWPESLYLLYCDTKVQGAREVAQGEGLSFHDVKGGGGTLSQPVFDHVAEGGVDPIVLFYLTDLQLGDMPRDPGYPVVWVVPESNWGYGYETRVGFGEVMRVAVDDTITAVGGY